MKQEMIQATASDAHAGCDHPPAERIWHATYVLYHQIADYLLCGWMAPIPNAPCHINAYGITMEWRCNCRMARPERCPA